MCVFAVVNLQGIWYIGAKHIDLKKSSDLVTFYQIIFHRMKKVVDKIQKLFYYIAYKDFER